MTEAELLAAVYAAPDDDGPRLVYADWLLERGDPRGEFIALQFAPSHERNTPAMRTRESELRARHGVAWAGALAKATPLEALMHFQRGFVETMLIGFDAPAHVAAVTNAPEWRTVRYVQVDEHRHEAPLDFYLADALRGLRRVDQCPARVAAAFLVDSEPRRIDTLHIGKMFAANAPDPDVVLRDELRAALLDGRGLPELRELQRLAGPATSHPDALAWFWPSRLGAQLEELALGFTGATPAVEPWLQAPLPPSLRTIRLLGTPVVELSRGADGRFSVRAP